MTAAMKIRPIHLNEQLLEEAVQCVQTIFREGFAMDVQLKSSHIGKDQIAVGDISGVVGMVQNQFEGNLILSFSQPVIFDILKRVYKTEFKEINDLVKDGAAELSNMVYGQLKLKLNERGHDLKMSLPNVVIGSGHNIHSTDKGSSLMAVFGYEDKEFNLFIALQGN